MVRAILSAIPTAILGWQLWTMADAIAPPPAEPVPAVAAAPPAEAAPLLACSTCGTQW